MLIYEYFLLLLLLLFNDDTLRMYISVVPTHKNGLSMKNFYQTYSKKAELMKKEMRDEIVIQKRQNAIICDVSDGFENFLFIMVSNVQPSK